MDIIERLEWRYATKKFDASKKVSQEKLSVLKKAFNLTATSYGLQPIKLLVLSDKPRQKELVKYSYGQQQVAQASHLLVLCIDNIVDKDTVSSYFDRVKAIRGTKDEVLNGFREFLLNDVTSKGISKMQESSVQQAYIALGNLLTVCAVEGIDSCPMEGFDAQKYSDYLGLHELEVTPVLLLPIGYRCESDFMAKMNKVRKKIANVVIDL